MNRGRNKSRGTSTHRCLLPTRLPERLRDEGEGIPADLDINDHQYYLGEHAEKGGKTLAILKETPTKYLLQIHYTLRGRAREIPGYVWNSDLKVWCYPKARETYEALVAEFGDELQDETAREESRGLAASPRWSAVFPDGIVTSGCGPYEEGNYDKILDKYGIEVHSLGTSGLTVLVLGRELWSEDDVNTHIESRRGNELRLYSQEMFLAYLATGQDPYDDDDSDTLEGFGEGHPAFDFLNDWGFNWPQTTIVPGRGLPDADDGDPSTWPQLGLLKHLGYSVGANGVSRWERQRILGDVLMESVPNVQSMQYMNEWGMPKSSDRLQKLANSLASFARNAKRRPSPPREAIREWEEDLAWLEQTFYQSRFRFRWPTT